mmetsp:Transcript_14540/g.36814  ORF Transcript_14540/g.36814 Transcript_14540/m.36814 type:complete len:212 (+) Transcript_14540:12-647(+)
MPDFCDSVAVGFLIFAFARLWPLSLDQLIRSEISSLTQDNSYLLSTNIGLRDRGRLVGLALRLAARRIEVGLYFRRPRHALHAAQLPEVRQEDDVVDRQAPGVEARGAVRVGATKQGLQFQKECGGARQQLGRLRNGLVVIESEFCGIFPNRIFGVAGICPVLNRHFCDARAHQRGDHLLEIFAPRVQVAPSRCGGDATRDAGRDVGADFE